MKKLIFLLLFFMHSFNSFSVNYQVFCGACLYHEETSNRNYIRVLIHVPPTAYEEFRPDYIRVFTSSTTFYDLPYAYHTFAYPFCDDSPFSYYFYYDITAIPALESYVLGLISSPPSTINFFIGNYKLPAYFPSAAPTSSSDPLNKTVDLVICPEKNTRCVGDFSYLIKSKNNYDDVYSMKLDDEEYANLASNVATKLASMGCYCGGIVYGGGLEDPLFTYWYHPDVLVTDTWDFGDGNPPTVFDSYHNPGMYDMSTFSMYPFEHVTAFSGSGSLQLCHTKKIEIGCARDFDNPLIVEDESMVPFFFNCGDLYHCTTCMCYNLCQSHFDDHLGHPTFKSSKSITKQTKTPVNDFMIYPNPTKDKLTIAFVSTGDNDIEITLKSMEGKIVKRNKSSVHKGDNKIDLLGLDVFSNGLYMIELSCNSKLFYSEKVRISH